MTARTEAPDTDHYWQNRAHTFDNYYRRNSGIVSRFLADRTDLMWQMLGHVRRATLVDVGCGSGVHMEMFLPTFERVVGLDLSEPMLARATRRLAGAPKPWWLVAGRADHLPLADACADVVFFIGVIEYLKSPADSVKEFRRIIAHDGVLLLTAPKRPSIFTPLRSRIGNRLRQWIFALPPVEQAYTRRDITDLLERGGFSTPRIVSLWNAVWVILATPAGKEDAPCPPAS